MPRQFKKSPTSGKNEAMIFQGYYEDKQKYLCDPAAESLDTREIIDAEIGEYAVIKHLRQLNASDDWFGYLSWKADLKLGGAFRKFLFESMEARSKCDFFYVNAMIFGRVLFKCPYYQGEWSGHNAMLKCARKLGLVEPFDHYAMNHYVVGNKKFWDFYISFHQELDQKMHSSSLDIAEHLFNSGHYSRNAAIPLVTFIRERALNNVMSNCGLNGMEFKIPLKSFAEKYKSALGSNLDRVYLAYYNGTLTSRLVEDICGGWELSARLLTSLDDPNLRSL